MSPALRATVEVAVVTCLLVAFFVGLGVLCAMFPLFQTVLTVVSSVTFVFFMVGLGIRRHEELKQRETVVELSSVKRG